MKHNKICLWIAVCTTLFLWTSLGYCQGSAAPTNVVAIDTPNDDGSSITVTWDVPAETSGIVGYNILSSVDGAEFSKLGEQLSLDDVIDQETNMCMYQDTSISRLNTYTYIIQAVTETGEISDSQATESVSAKAQIFHTGKIPLFLAMLLFSAAIVGSIYHARSGKEVFVRRIPGLEAVDEAIGRATEMGRSILYVLGLGSVSNVATIASMTILGQVARRTADYETPLRVPCNDPVVLNVVREMVKTSYLDEGRPDAYNEDNIFFITESQFAYAAGVDGMMIREQPAAIFLQGTFYAESLILAETGNSIGAIQIAGTDSEAQLPFFIAACDYTLIGEELYAASAYLAREPMLLGSLRGQDWGKLFIFGLIVLGVILELTGINWITTLLQNVR
ncbi:hypothetical protein C6497_07825 [Candidatus Poribacteria bacterium]|nr:MAG: hypothetical protein C6497_07825 [Candidatus Poribacteria bacterium]